MTPEIFWQLTPREYVALKAGWTAHRDNTLNLYAGLMTQISRSWLKRTDGRDWLPSDFVPEDVLPQRRPQTWQEQKTILGAIFTNIKEQYRAKKKANEAA